MRAGVWIRVSTEEQAKGESPKHHEVRARMYAEMKGWEVVEIYDLSGVSGKEILSHPETQRMLNDVKTGRIQALIFSKLARLARNVKELLEIAEVFQKHNANLVSLEESIDTSSPAGRLLFVVIGALAQWEREEIAERVRASVPIRAKLGKPTGGVGPFGYKWENGKLVINEEEAYVVKRAFQLYLETGKLLTTCQKLKEEGLKARKSYFRPVTLKRILTDMVYKGIKRANYTRPRGKGKSWEYKPVEEWVYFQVDPIIDEELWEKVNLLIKANEEKYKTSRIPKEGKYLFSGFVVCGYCGKKMYVNPYDGMKDPIYSCRGCEKKTKIRESLLEKKVKESLSYLVLNPEEFQAIVKEERRRVEVLEERIANLEKEKKRIKAKIEKLFSLWEEELIDKETFKQRYEKLKEEEGVCEYEVAKARGELEFWKVKELSFDHLINEAVKIKDLWDYIEYEEKREVLKYLLDRIQVYEDKVLIFLAVPEFIGLCNYTHTRDVGIISEFCKNSKPTSGFKISLDIIPQERFQGKWYPKEPKTIGEVLRKIRLEKGLKVKEVAKFLGVTEDTILNWELRGRKPKQSILPKVIEFINSLTDQVCKIQI